MPTTTIRTGILRRGPDAFPSAGAIRHRAVECGRATGLEGGRRGARPDPVDPRGEPRVGREPQPRQAGSEDPAKAKNQIAPTASAMATETIITVSSTER